MAVNETAPRDKPADTDEKRAEDVAYTINHAVACTAADVAGPYVNHKVAKWLFHSHGGVLSWFIGEGVGDVAAVPATIAIQRHAPRLTNAVRKGMEKTLGWAFRKSARREAQGWAKDQGLAKDSLEAKDKERQIYSYEVEHMPQAAIWTATSMIFNVATQKLFHKQLHKGHDHGSESLLKLTGALVVGKTLSTGAVLGFRAGFPDKAHQWDKFAARHVFEPLENATSKVLGTERPVDSKTDNWEKRVGDTQDATQGAMPVAGRG